MLRRPTISTLFPYTTLFRSRTSRRSVVRSPGYLDRSSSGSRTCTSAPDSRRPRGERWETPSPRRRPPAERSEEHTSELQSRQYLVCRLLLEKKEYRYW